jgi:hypothetical protein
MMLLKLTSFVVVVVIVSEIKLLQLRIIDVIVRILSYYLGCDTI